MKQYDLAFRVSLFLKNLHFFAFNLSASSLLRATSFVVTILVYTKLQAFSLVLYRSSYSSGILFCHSVIFPLLFFLSFSFFFTLSCIVMSIVYINCSVLISFIILFVTLACESRFIFLEHPVKILLDRVTTAAGTTT